MRDLYRPGSGMTPRRLLVLIRALPYDALTWRLVEAAQQKALTSVDRLRERAAHYAPKGATVD